MADTGPKKECAVCAQPSTLSCANCAKYDVRVREHQQQGWKQHKGHCGAKHAAGGSSGSGDASKVCARCLGACDGTPCRVEHPVHLRQDCGAMMGGAMMKWDYAEVGAKDGAEAKTRTTGARWYYQGQHSAGRLADGDERRVALNAVVLEAGADIQARIDALPETVTTLTICSGLYDHGNEPTLARRLPQLKTLKLKNVAFSQVTLNATLTPRLRSLTMKNVPESCDLEVVLTSLRDVSIQFWGGDPQVLDDVLAAATKLQTFDSYKLWSNSELTFASNKLESIDLHRADCLQSIRIWAPSLAHLSVQACYSLEDIEFLRTHELAASLPAGHRPPPRLMVNSENACQGRRAQAALRARGADYSAPAYDAMPTEAMFAGMHGAFGGGAF
ncbi:hypothetical protein FOA52_001421 [Chlamydomonas sp. UWO 241]|nr:hypothetical protein FOA52_001421 [Chlamydomonas sp. UWO 241]